VKFLLSHEELSSDPTEVSYIGWRGGGEAPGDCTINTHTSNFYVTKLFGLG
jgi:hypothetical protein